jgi:hypothetical protein
MHVEQVVNEDKDCDPNKVGSMSKEDPRALIVPRVECVSLVQCDRHAADERELSDSEDEEGFISSLSR